MSVTRIFVGSLPRSIDELNNILKVLLQGYTVVGDFIIPKNTNKRTGGSCGYAFVNMSTSSEAERAIAELSGKEIGGRKVTVAPAKDKEGTQHKDQR